MSVALLSMQGQKAPRFHYKYLNLCSEDERMKIKVLWVRNNMRVSNLFIVESTIPLYKISKKIVHPKSGTCLVYHCSHELWVRLLIGQELPNDFVHDVL